MPRNDQITRQWHVLRRLKGSSGLILDELVEAVPDDFTFRLTREEAAAITDSRSQSVILKRGKNIKYLPYFFTEHSAIMAANVLNCEAGGKGAGSGA